MGLFSRWRSSKVQVTTEDLGKLLLRAASELAQDLVPHLMKAGLSPGAELAFHATMFSMFPLEMIVAKHFAEKAPEIGAAMRGALVDVTMDAGISSKTQDQWDEYLVDKFIEHAGRFASVDSPLALTKFGLAAAEDLFGTTDPYVAMVLSQHFTTIMTSYPEAIAKYHIVDAR